MVCQCCRQSYVRGHFVCCKPPNGMRSEAWLERHCSTCRKCPRHCACEQAAAPLVAVDGWTHVKAIRPTEAA